MTAGGNPPDDIMQSVSLIRSLQGKTYLSRTEREELNRAKLKVAFWACRTERVAATRDNLSYILGKDAADIMSAYDKYLKRDDGKGKDGGASKRQKGDSQFWGNV